MSKRLLTLAVVLVAFAFAGTGQAFAATLIVDDDGMASPPANCGALTPASSSIEGAVEAASPGDTVNVCPGTYPGQVSLEVDENGVTLRSLVFRAAVITPPQLPVLMAEPGDLVTVNGAQNVTIRDFTIAGPLPDYLFCSVALRSGVRVIGGGSATVRGNRITEMRAANPLLRGCQNGFGLAVGRQFEGQTGRVIAFGNDIDRYQKGGIYVDNVGSTAVLDDNVVAGNGPDPQIAQNGVQISRGAVATVTDNLVQDNTYALAPASSASGVMLFGAGAQTTVAENRILRNDDNIVVFGGVTGARILNNTILDSTFFDGIYMEADTSNNRIEGNFLRNNSEHDCHDNSNGAGTGGTANFWIDNDGLTDNRGGAICEIDDDDDEDDDDGDDEDDDDDDGDGEDDEDDRGDED